MLAVSALTFSGCNYFVALGAAFADRTHPFVVPDHCIGWAIVSALFFIASRMKA